MIRSTLYVHLMFISFVSKRYSNIQVKLNVLLFNFFSFSLKYVNIAMVTILKNVTNILTALGELYLFRKHQNQKVWTAMFLMVISTLLTISQETAST